MKWRAKAVVAILVIGVCWFLTAPHLATWLVVERPLDHADAIVVLSGSFSYTERTKKAAELYRNGVSPRIFITDDGEIAGWDQNARTNLPFVELEKRELIRGGVPAEAIAVLPGKVSGTGEEAQSLAAELNDRPLGSILIVTSAYHTRRALRTFDKILAGKSVELGIEHAPLEYRSPMPDLWWLHRSGWNSVASEYFKSLGYWVYY